MNSIIMTVWHFYYNKTVIIFKSRRVPVPDTGVDRQLSPTAAATARTPRLVLGRRDDGHLVVGGLPACCAKTSRVDLVAPDSVRKSLM